MKPQVLRHLIIALLSLTGIFHLAVAMLGGAPGLGLPLAGFGLLYIVIGFYVRADTNDGSKSHSRNAIIAAIAACTLGLALGGTNYLQNGGPLALPIMFAIDVVIIGAGVMWLMKKRAKR
ncbi:MAG: hypothetical protein AAFW68_00285 [Pseudomonadota bacterium]